MRHAMMRREVSNISLDQTQDLLSWDTTKVPKWRRDGIIGRRRHRETDMTFTKRLSVSSFACHLVFFFLFLVVSLQDSSCLSLWMYIFHYYCPYCWLLTSLQHDVSVFFGSLQLWISLLLICSSCHDISQKKVSHAWEEQGEGQVFSCYSLKKSFWIQLHFLFFSSRIITLQFFLLCRCVQINHESEHHVSEKGNLNTKRQEIR
jgi:hypothetical protein